MARAWVSATGTVGDEAQKMVRVHRHARAWELVRSERGAARYALKYAMKPEQKMVPKDYRDVGRFWGCSRDVSRSANQEVGRLDCSEGEARLLAEIRGRDMGDYDTLPTDIWLPD